MIADRRPDGARILFFGTPDFALPTLQALIDSPWHVVAAVTQPDRPRGRGQAMSPSPVKQLALDHGIPVLQPARLRDEGVADELEECHADLGVVAAYGQIVPDRMLHATRLGLINVHASLLPAYRGAAPVHRAIIAGEHETGVTIMRLVQELDAGPMLAKASRPIGADETSDTVEHALAMLGAPLLIETVDRLLAGEATEEKQDSRQATYASRIVRADGVIDWSRQARDVHNLVRGLHPWPHAFTYLDGHRYVIRRSAVASAEADAPPGVILMADERLVVSTGAGGALEILELQREGRRPMAAEAFLAGHRLEPGSAFGPGGTP